MSAAQAATGLLQAGGDAGRFVPALESQGSEFWAEVLRRFIEAIDSIDEASAGRLWEAESALWLRQRSRLKA